MTAACLETLAGSCRTLTPFGASPEAPTFSCHTSPIAFHRSPQLGKACHWAGAEDTILWLFSEGSVFLPHPINFPGTHPEGFALRTDEMRIRRLAARAHRRCVLVGHLHGLPDFSRNPPWVTRGCVSPAAQEFRTARRGSALAGSAEVHQSQRAAAVGHLTCLWL